MLPLGTLILLSAVGGLLGLDSTGALQVMLSRPLVVGALFGVLLGNLSLGLVLGSMVELLCIAGPPVGSLVPPDSTAAAAAAATVAVRLAHLRPGHWTTAAAALGFLAAVPAGALGARAEVWQRRWTNRLSRRADAELDAGRLPRLGILLAAALGMAFLRGFLVCALVLGVGVPVLAGIFKGLPVEGLYALRWSFWLFWLLGLAVAADQFWDRRGLRTAAGVSLGVAVFGAAVGAGQGEVLAAVIGAAGVAGVWIWLANRNEGWT